MTVVIEESVVLAQPFDEVLDRVKLALKDKGFGVLTEIDVQATLKEKLGKTIGRYLILGACNPTLASRALEVEPQIGVLLPCNVVVRETQEGVAVEAMDPGIIATLTGRGDIRPISDEARQLLGDALAQLSSKD
jgi:uncharacterized protein (DUF302 family)